MEFAHQPLHPIGARTRLSGFRDSSSGPASTSVSRRATASEVRLKMRTRASPGAALGTAGSLDDTLGPRPVGVGERGALWSPTRAVRFARSSRRWPRLELLRKRLPRSHSFLTFRRSWGMFSLCRVITSATSGTSTKSMHACSAPMYSPRREEFVVRCGPRASTSFSPTGPRPDSPSSISMFTSCRERSAIGCPNCGQKMRIGTSHNWTRSRACSGPRSRSSQAVAVRSIRGSRSRRD